MLSGLAMISAGSRSTLAEVIASRGWNVTTNALQRHLDKARIVERGMAVLCNILAGPKELAHQVLSQDTMLQIYAVMAAHPRHVAVLEQSCYAILNAAAIDILCKVLLMEARLAPELVLAITAHPTAASLQEAACSALANLAAGLDNNLDDPDTDEQSSEPMVAEREVPCSHDGLMGTASGAALPQHVEQLSSFFNDGRVSTSPSRSQPQRPHHSPQALHAVTSIRHALVEAGAAEAVVTVLQRFLQKFIYHPHSRTESSAVLIEAMAMLRNLADGGQLCRLAILNASGAEAILGAMAAQATNYTLVHLGCLALRNLGSGPAVQLKLILAAGGVEGALSALSVHSQLPAVVAAACAALRNFAVDSWQDAQLGVGPQGSTQPVGAAKAIMEAGGIGTALRAMVEHAGSASVQIECCGILRNIACGTMDDDTSRLEAIEALLSAGAVQASVTVPAPNCRTSTTTPSAALTVHGLCFTIQTPLHTTRWSVLRCKGILVLKVCRLKAAGCYAIWLRVPGLDRVLLLSLTPLVSLHTTRTMGLAVGVGGKRT